jgi:hypothetical protein
MIAVRLEADMRMAVVGVPFIFRSAPRPRTQTPQDLANHHHINSGLPAFGGLYAWEFEKGKHDLKVHIEAQLVLNEIASRLQAALAGFDPAYLPEDQVTRTSAIVRSTARDSA